MSFSISEILKVTRGQLISGSRRDKVVGVCTNSKNIQPKELFIALKGERFDGHDFLSEAIEQQAAALIVAKKKLKFLQVLIRRFSGRVAWIAVDDPVKALGEIARFHRQRFSIPVIAITGSAGKTTSKEMVARILESRFRVLKNVGTENNFIGVPQTLLKLNSSHQVAVLEVGTNQPGDIAWLTYVVNPQVAILTNIGESHLQRLGSAAKVFAEKIQLVRGIKKGGKIILNRDDRFLRQLLFDKKLSHQVITFGIGHTADFQAHRIHRSGHQQLEFEVNGCKIFLPTTMRENIYNALAAVSCGRIFSVTYSAIAKALKNFSSSPHRQEVHRISERWVIDDSYNANPVSFRSAVNVLQEFPSQGQRILVCADMLELGKRSRQLHQAMGEKISQAKIDAVFAYGNFSQEIVKTIRQKKNKQKTFHYRKLNALHRRLLEFCRPEDVILIKGSRGMKMEKTLEFLKSELK